MIFRVDGRPQGKARARTFYDAQSRKMRSVTPESTRVYEEAIRWAFVAQRGSGGPRAASYRVDILAAYKIPKAWSESKRAAALRGEVPVTAKPDADNVIKVVLDALNGLAWEDDRQVTQVSCRKVYRMDEFLGIKIEEDIHEQDFSDREPDARS